MSEPVTLEAEVVQMIQANSACLEKAAAAWQRYETEKQACASIIPEVVEELAKHGRIEPEEKQACAEALADPYKALQLLKFAAAHRGQAEASSLPARPVDGEGRTKKAGFVPVGGRREDRQSDAEFDRILGLVD